MATQPPRPRSRKKTEPGASRTVLMDLYDQPGHLIRRAHQIATGMFSEMVGSHMTPIQYAILRMVHEVPGIDQVGLAKRIAFDTSTTASTAARLEAKGWLVRNVADNDRRQLKLTLTAEGEALLADSVDGVHAMRETMLGALEPGEQELLMGLLGKFVHLQNGSSRAPLGTAETAIKRPSRRTTKAAALADVQPDTAGEQPGGEPDKEPGEKRSKSASKSPSKSAKG